MGWHALLGEGGFGVGRVRVRVSSECRSLDIGSHVDLSLLRRDLVSYFYSSP
jgi:hypothetical protein